MEQQFSSESQNNLMKLFDVKRKEIVSHCKEVAENEFDLFEFNLFLASFGKDKLDESTKIVRELRKKSDKDKIDLSEYEDLLDEY